MKLFLGLAALCGLFWAASPAHASVDDGTTITPETLRPLARWVERATGMRIKTMPLAIASSTVLKTTLGLQGVQQARSVGAYMPGRIIISSGIYEEDSLRAKSYVVHEMVHHAQLLNHRHYPCHEAKEREAYILQNRWLEEQGEDPIYSEHWIEQIARCQ